MKLTKREKVVLCLLRDYEKEIPLEKMPYTRDIMIAIMQSLADKELIKAICTKTGAGGFLTPKGKLLFADNPKLRTAPSGEIIRWIIGTVIAAIAAIASIISCLKFCQVK